MLSPRTQATLLLTAWLGPKSATEHRPLDVREWHALAEWLYRRNLGPESLVEGGSAAIFGDLDDLSLERERLARLLDRGHMLAQRVDEWSRFGIWVLVRSDQEYPSQLRDRLGDRRPPLLFGCGDKKLLSRSGIAIVGSRDATPDDLRFADDLGAAVCEAGYTVISGGARGVDDHAAKGAFRTGEGAVVAVLAESLIKSVSLKRNRDRVDEQRLVLVTPFSPETGFSPGNAMSRNKLIYCLAEAAIAVSSTDGSGGTFGGASINLRADWTPLHVACTNDPASGNHTLAASGAHWLPRQLERLNVEALIHPNGDSGTLEPEESPVTMSSPLGPPETSLPSLYEVFLQHWRRAGAAPIAPGVIAAILDIHTRQAREWMDRAVAEGIAIRQPRPVRYRLIDDA